MTPRAFSISAGDTVGAGVGAAQAARIRIKSELINTFIDLISYSCNVLIIRQVFTKAGARLAFQLEWLEDSFLRNKQGGLELNYKKNETIRQRKTLVGFFIKYVGWGMGNHCILEKQIISLMGLG
jgi:hypothetical protein